MIIPFKSHENPMNIVEHPNLKWMMDDGVLPPGGRHQGRHRFHLVGHRKVGAREHTHTKYT